ncbi:MAG: ATP-binding protein [Dehalococcoidales bacterium]|nr:MAG: ATP-binding protein [Dehalococcoidales bacterium]
MSEEIVKTLGIVVSGSVDKGVEVRLDSSASVEEMVVGRYVTIEGRQRRFFGMITDISLGVTDPQLIINPPDTADPFLSEVLNGTATYGTIHVLPMLTIGGDVASLIEGPQPVKTVPSHFSTVSLASDADMNLVFGEEDANRFFIGNPLDMETKLCLDLPEFAKRSNGIFGKSGTGKTFLTRILLIGMLQKSQAVNLIFDMHNEYGWEGSSEEGRRKVKALKQLFPEKVAVFTLDPENSKRRGVSTDFVVKIGYDEIEPEDMVLLRQTLNITDLAVEASYQLRRRFGRQWIQRTLDVGESEDTQELIKELNIHESTFQSLRRGLQTISRLSFIEPHAPVDAVNTLLGYLDKGMNVVLEFGRYRDITAYVLVANMLARRIYARYQERMERSMSEDVAPPNPLVITIEEAHKFLNPEVASRAIFGTIAREMRKYNVSLLVIDQRPSGIDEEVMSQLGTKITCLLDNEKDIDSVLAGVSGKSELKSVLARLAPKQQALIFGHAVPMPVPIRTREYGSAESYQGFIGADKGRQTKKDIEELWD